MSAAFGILLKGENDVATIVRLIAKEVKLVWMREGKPLGIEWTDRVKVQEFLDDVGCDCLCDHHNEEYSNAEVFVPPEGYEVYEDEHSYAIIECVLHDGTTLTIKSRYHLFDMCAGLNPIYVDGYLLTDVHDQLVLSVIFTNDSGYKGQSQTVLTDFDKLTGLKDLFLRLKEEDRLVPDAAIGLVATSYH